MDNETTSPDAVDERGAEINSLTLALEAHKVLLSESLLREGHLLNALHEIAALPGTPSDELATAVNIAYSALHPSR